MIGLADEGIVSWNRVRISVIDVEPEQRAQQRVVVLSVAKRITGILDETQLMARLSGDEFAILLPGLSNPTVAGRVAEMILETLQAASENPDTDSPISTTASSATQNRE